MLDPACECQGCAPIKEEIQRIKTNQKEFQHILPHGNTHAVGYSSTDAIKISILILTYLQQRVSKTNVIVLFSLSINTSGMAGVLQTECASWAIMGVFLGEASGSPQTLHAGAFALVSLLRPGRGLIFYVPASSWQTNGSVYRPCCCLVAQ